PSREGVGLVGLARGAQVDHRARRPGDAGGRRVAAAWGVGPVQRPRLDAAPVRDGDAADVAEVLHALLLPGPARGALARDLEDDRLHVLGNVAAPVQLVELGPPDLGHDALRDAGRLGFGEAAVADQALTEALGLARRCGRGGRYRGRRGRVVRRRR